MKIIYHKCDVPGCENVSNKNGLSFFDNNFEFRMGSDDYCVCGEHRFVDSGALREALEQDSDSRMYG